MLKSKKKNDLFIQKILRFPTILCDFRNLQLHKPNMKMGLHFSLLRSWLLPHLHTNAKHFYVRVFTISTSEGEKSHRERDSSCITSIVFFSRKFNIDGNRVLLFIRQNEVMILLTLDYLSYIYGLNDISPSSIIIIEFFFKLKVRNIHYHCKYRNIAW